MSQPLSRSTRNTSFWSSATPDNVGPGSYESFSPTGTSSKLSLAPRPRRLFPSSYSPGPAAYNVTVSSKLVGSTKGSSGFVSGQARIAPPGSNGITHPSSFSTPGPGTYDLGAKSRRSHPRPKRPVVSDVKRTPSSIPVTLSDQSETSPASYMPTLALVHSTAQAPTFGASKDRRKLWEYTNERGNAFSSRDNPGPGTYQVKPGFGTEKVKENATFASRVPLLHEQKKTESDATPGPGAYDPPRTSEIPHELVSFGSKCNRGEMWANSLELPYTRPDRLHVPGVGSYETAYRRRRLKSEAPFSVQQKRDCLKALPRDEKPGPGSYTPDLVMERKSSRKSEVTPTPRFKDGLFEPKPGPPPGHYHRERHTSTGKAANASFRSVSERFRAHLRGNANISVVGESHSPPVGSYDVRTDWGSPERHRANISFDSSSRRFRPEESFPGHQHPDTPGPGMYDTTDNAQGGLALSKAKRFSDPKAQHTGPGSYSYENSLIKKTFNYTIDPPGDRPRLWTLA